MPSTKNSKSYETSATPSPKPTPSEPPPSEPPNEADAELEELSAANALLSSQVQSYAAQVVSLTALLAERGMAEIWRHKWADLSRVATTDYISGRYQIVTPRSDDQVLRVTLRWEPGQVLLCESFHQTEKNTLILPLPSVRMPKHYPVLPPPPGTIPPRPAMSTGTMQSTSQNQTELPALDQHSQAWKVYLQPILAQVIQAQTAAQKEALRDEEELAYLAIQAIQKRRQNPKKPPGQTIAATLEEAVEEMRNRVARDRC